MNPATLLPLYVETYYPGLNSLYTGILFSVYSIVGLIVGPLAAGSVKSFGRRRTIFAAIIMNSVSTVVFGLAGLLNSTWQFYALSFVARIFQGAGDSLIYLVIPSIIAVEYPDNQTKYQGYFECTMGVGLFSGPVIATVVFGWLGYVGT